MSCDPSSNHIWLKKNLRDRPWSWSRWYLQFQETKLPRLVWIPLQELGKHSDNMEMTVVQLYYYLSPCFFIFIFSKLNVFSSSLTCLGWYTGIRQFDISEMTFTLSRFDAILISCLIANPSMIPNIPKVHETRKWRKTEHIQTKKILLNSAPFHNDQWAGYRWHRKEAKKKKMILIHQVQRRKQSIRHWQER